MRAAIAGVSVWGPGLPGWHVARPVLAGRAPYDPAMVAEPPVPDFLSPTERRRAGLAVRLALSVARQAADMAGLAPGALRSLFATANGDGALVHAILETLAVPGRPVSPTQFHNSVHNAAAGYWTIAHGATRPASCLGCHDASFAAALLKAVAEVVVENEPVLLCVYDVGLPVPLKALRPGDSAFAAGLVLVPAGGDGGAGLGEVALEYVAEAAEDPPRAADLRALFHDNPAARALALLEALALERPARFAAGLLDGAVRITFTPMLDRAGILRLIPHQGAMCLLDRVTDWTARTIGCTATTHLARDNPLRRDGRLGAVAGIEYGLQAACLHGALIGGGPQPAGYLAALRDVRLVCDRLDDPAIGALTVRAALELRQASGMIYRFTVDAADGATLVEGRATIMLPPDLLPPDLLLATTPARDNGVAADAGASA